MGQLPCLRGQERRGERREDWGGEGRGREEEWGEGVEERRGGEGMGGEERGKGRGGEGRSRGSPGASETEQLTFHCGEHTSAVSPTLHACCPHALFGNPGRAVLSTRTAWTRDLVLCKQTPTHSGFPGSWGPGRVSFRHHSVPPLSTGRSFQDPQQMPKTSGSTKPDKDYVLA